MKAFGYIRCSGVGQLDGDGPSRQRAAIQEFADKHGITIERWFMESHTGTDLEGRPEFRAMRLELVSDGIRLVIVERVDRLARDIMIQETILADFRKNGIDLKSATPGEEDLCGNDPTRTLIRQILGCFAQYERSMIVAKLNAGRRRKKANGQRSEGRLPYGSKDGEPGILADIFEASQHGMTASMIADILNSQKRFSRTQRPWKPFSISRIIQRSKPLSNPS